MSALEPQGCEILAWRIALLARAVRRGAASQPPGIEWQRLVHAAARSSRPYLEVQGPGERRLFGRLGSSGRAAEFDTAVSHDWRTVSILESKSAADHRLHRDAALVLSGKVRDHERAPGFRWRRVNVMVASGGLVGPDFCGWCFAEAIDVADPQRFPLGVLARLPVLVPPETGDAWLWQVYGDLRGALALTHERVLAGPVCAREALAASCQHPDWLARMQAELSQLVWAALAEAHGGEAALLQHVASGLALRGVTGLPRAA